jgi:hypothetical protein
MMIAGRELWRELRVDPEAAERFRLAMQHMDADPD